MIVIIIDFLLDSALVMAQKKTRVAVLARPVLRGLPQPA